MNRACVLAAAQVLDALAGDPDWSPHPVRAIGRLTDALYPRLAAALADSPLAGRGAGVGLWIAVVGAAYAAARASGWMLRRLDRRAGEVFEVLGAASTLALRNLCEEVACVARLLENGDLPAARSALARIVGRDTQDLGTSEIARAAIETLAESLCDGVVAPLLALAAGGVPLAFAYKAINTLDSMVGHVEPPYTYVGWCAARMDDLANVVPARLCAAALVLSAQVCERSGAEAWRTWMRDGRRHASPNAGQSEAAMAGALRVRLGGENRYGGRLTASPPLGDEFAPPLARDVRRALRVAIVAAAFVYAAAVAVLALRDAA